MSPAERFSASRSRVVLVTRQTRLELLRAQHSTQDQARFYLFSRQQSIDPLVEQHEIFQSALLKVQQSIPTDQRCTRVDRDSLDRFLFAPDDVVLIVGQDGLVPNTAKYLKGQLAAGINPDPASYEGVLCQHQPEDVPDLLRWAERPEESNKLRVEERTLACARREDGQSLLALNDVFVGHRTHQSARYKLHCNDKSESQSSSGVIVSTGTGASGWARSIARQRGLDESSLPAPCEPRLAWFVREPWPSLTSSTDLTFGFLSTSSELKVISEMGEGGVVFADGIEGDRLDFLEGQQVYIGVAEQRLRLIVRS